MLKTALRVGPACTTLFLAWMVLVPAAPAPGQFRELVARIPPDANVVAIFNLEKAKKSAMGQREQWETSMEQAFEEGITRVPPQTTQLVVAAKVDFEFAKPDWQVGVLNTNTPVSVEAIARRNQAGVDTIRGKPAVVLPSDAYVLVLGEKTLAAMSPANRQAVDRWVKSMEKPSTLSPYLQQAAVYSDDAGTEIIIAIDLEAAFPTAVINGYFAAKENLTDAQRKDLAAILYNLKGVRVGIRIGERPTGSVVVDFGGEVSLDAELGKSVLLAVLDDAGMAIPDLQSWKAEQKATTLSLSGELSNSGLQRLLSLVDSPVPSGDVAEAETAAPESSATPSASPSDTVVMMEATREHFRAINALLRDLKNDLHDVKTISSNSLWFDRYARRIERLPILHVDPEMLDYSAQAANLLRTASGSVKSMGIRTGVRSRGAQANSSPYAYGGYGYGRTDGYGYSGWYGYGYGMAGGVSAQDQDLRNQAQYRNTVRSQERGAMAAEVQNLRGQLITSTSEIRRRMTEKYQVEF